MTQILKFAILGRAKAIPWMPRGRHIKVLNLPTETVAPALRRLRRGIPMAPLLANISKASERFKTTKWKDWLSARVKLALFCLVLITLLGYSLTRGVYVGSEVQFKRAGYYVGYCKYLYPSGITLKSYGVGDIRDQASLASSHCPFLNND
jgi:hypothetical protein